jgi:predicted PurR-regulated permease PerM
MAFSQQQKKWILVGLFIVFLILAFYMIRNYLGAIFVGGLIAYFLYPVYKRLCVKLNSTKWAKILVAVVSVGILVGAILLVYSPVKDQVDQLDDQAEQFIKNAVTWLNSCTLSDSFECKVVQKLGFDLSKEDLQLKINEAIQDFRDNIFKGIPGIVSGILQFVIFIFITAFSVFYFLEDGPKIGEGIKRMIPLQVSHKDKIFKRLTQTINAVVGGNIITGVIATTIFFLVGVPSSLFWGLIMTILAFIPVIGPPLIWIPTGIILIVQGEVRNGIILLIACAAILTPIENLLKPKLIAGKIQLSTFAIFLSVFGGLATFGILGLFIGPIIVALLVTCSEIYKEM